MTASRMTSALIFLQVFNLASSANLWNFRKQYVPPSVLIVTSPEEKKVSYTSLDGFKGKGRISALVDAGLGAPYGVAYDPQRSAMYVCDSSLKKIFRYKLKATECKSLACKNDGIPFELSVDGDRTTIVDGARTQWATVDNKGNLYFTDLDNKSVDKVTLPVIERIVKGLLLPKDLGKTSEPEAEGEEAAKESDEDSPLKNPFQMGSLTTATTTPEPQIVRLYETGSNGNVGTPSGLLAAGPRLYWANQAGGNSRGSVAWGRNEPRVKQPAEGEDKPSFPTAKVANNTAAAFGVALTESKVLYTDNDHYVWAANQGTGDVVALTSSMLKPRGIVWDGDNTAYVADQDANLISSMPVGLLKPNAPVSRALDIKSPFGLALVGKRDPIWTNFMKDFQGGATRVANLGFFALIAVSAAVGLTL